MSAVAALPPVTGQHRNRGLADACRSEAIRFRTQGYTYEQIARQLGYANRGAVHRLIRDALHKQTKSSADELLALEISRLGALQETLWDKAMAGNVDACVAVARVINERARMLGVHAASHQTTLTPRSVVVPDLSCAVEFGVSFPTL